MDFRTLPLPGEVLPGIPVSFQFVQGEEESPGQ